METARHAESSGVAFEETRRLVERLLARDLLEMVERRPHADSVRLVVRDPLRRVRAALDLPYPPNSTDTPEPPEPASRGSAGAPESSARPQSPARPEPTAPSEAPAGPERPSGIPVPLPQLPAHANPPGQEGAPAVDSPSRGGTPRLTWVPLPLPEEWRTGMRFEHAQELLAAETSLVAHDRVVTPREITARLRRLLQDLLPGVQAAFHPVTMPPGDAWPPLQPAALGLPRNELESLAETRSRLLVLEQDAGLDSVLLGMGDEVVGWSGILALERTDGASSRPFSEEGISTVVLVATHFQSLLTNVFRLQGLIFYDFLTGVYNRAFYEEQMEREIRLARRRGQTMALLIVDIDDFKAFNTRFGYDGGDRVLATVACVLKGALRGTDTLARYGGEEFAIILAPPIPVPEALSIAERLRNAVEQEPFQISDLRGERVEQRLTVSIGGALFPDTGTTPRDLWTAANREVLAAKAGGKNQVRFAEPSEDA